VSELAVILGDSVAGTLTRLRAGRLRFDYADDYGARTPLSLSMPVQVRSHPDGVVTPWLWGLLPDNEAVLRRWARVPRVGRLAVLDAGHPGRRGLRGRRALCGARRARPGARAAGCWR
jgi:HipA-like protein